MAEERIAKDNQDHLGLTDAQWTVFQQATRGYGEQDANGVDIAMLRENLKLTPTQRLQRLEAVRAFFRGMNDGRIRRVS